MVAAKIIDYEVKIKAAHGNKQGSSVVLLGWLRVVPPVTVYSTSRPGAKQQTRKMAYLDGAGALGRNKPR